MRIAEIPVRCCAAVLEKTARALLLVVLGLGLYGTKDVSGADKTGDSLPKGAMLRLGAVASAEEPSAESISLSSVRGVAFSPDGKLIATRGEPADPAAPQKIRIWSAADGRLIRTIVRRGPVTAMAFSPKGGALVTVSPDDVRGTQVHDVETGKLVAALPGGRGKVRFSVDGRSVAIADWFGRSDVIVTYRLEDEVEIGRSVVAVSHRLEFSSDGERLLCLKSQRAGDLRVLEIKTGEELARLKLPDGEPGAMTFSPDGHTVAAALRKRNGDGKREDVVVLWELASRRPVFQLAGHSGRVLAVAFSAGGRFLVTGGADGTVLLWEGATGRLVHRFEGHRGPVSAVAVSPDGTRIVSGSFDRTVLVWDLRSAAGSVPPPPPLDEQALEAAWESLASEDPSVAYPVMGRLRAEGGRAVDYLPRRIEAILVPVEARRVRALIRELDHDDFRVRNRATRELKQLVEIARPLLLKALEETTSEEVRHRLHYILSTSENAPRFTSTDILRMLRTIYVMEDLPGAQTQAALDLIAAEFPDERVVNEARRAVLRMERKRTGFGD